MAEDSTYSTDDTTPVTGTMNATDPDDDPLTFYQIMQPTSGTLVVNDAATGEFTYTPTTGVTGQFSFTFAATDGALVSNVGTVTITVTGPNVPPVVEDGSITTSQNTPVNGTLVATDANDDPLTYSIVENGTLGTAVITDANTGAFTYTPNDDVTGTDTFTFIANDGQADSNTATIDHGKANYNQYRANRRILPSLEDYGIRPVRLGPA